jgi:hypothetical protein
MLGYDVVLTDSFPGLDVRLIDSIVCDAGVLASIATATRNKVV